MQATIQAPFIPATEFARRAGISYRQMDYWLTSMVIPFSGRSGSGNRRKIHQDYLPVAVTMGRISRALNGPSRTNRDACSMEMLKEIAANYSRGYLRLPDGITLTWPVLTLDTM